MKASVLRQSLAAVVLLAVACSTRAPSRIIPDAPRPAAPVGTLVRVAIPVSIPQVGATTDFTWYDANGRTALARGRRAGYWRLERNGARIRAVSPGGAATDWQRGLVLRVASGGFVAVNGKRYRGELLALPVNDAITVINRVSLDDYLRGVVAVEMGPRPMRDSAAVQAQAVASRSYVVSRLGDARRPYDVVASTIDQAYGGLEAENAVANAAVERTHGLVLRYHGRVVDALYSSTCGGTTAAPDEIWDSPAVPYLQRVSDRIPGSDRWYCDIAPRFRWSREWSGDELNATLSRYLAQYTTGLPAGQSPGDVRDLVVRSRTPTERVEVLEVQTTRGTYRVMRNDIRSVLREAGGGILSSTYFSVEAEHRDGVISRVTLHGRGFGHGVGMCQWGAIGRARAGHSFRAILGTYYPGTSIVPLE